jgi:hypothetical protein
MSRMIQIRNVPDALHRKLKARAAHEGKSLSDYLLDEMARLAELPTIDEWVERLHSRAPVRLTRSTAEWVREDRDSR